MDPALKPELTVLLLRAVVVGTIAYFGIKMVVNAMDPTHSQRKKSQKKASEVLGKLGLGSKLTDLNEHEFMIAGDLLDPNDIDVGFGDIAGLDNIIEELQLEVIMPLVYPEYFTSNLRQPPRGVLFYGPPGCGKTMLAKAIAKEANIRFVNLSVSALTDKWYGESQKLASAVFTLALKIQPCIIFIDEIDSFLRSRDSHDHEATAMMKAQFMTLWEGILSSKKSQIVLIGATNRPQDVDNAVLRRMPAMFKVELPKEKERRQILELILKDENLASDVDLDEIASLTQGYSGSDLRDLCRRAAMKSLKELNADLYTNSRESSSSSTPEHVVAEAQMADSGSFSPANRQRQILLKAKASGIRAPELRSITMADFVHAIHAIDQGRTGMKPMRRIPLD